MGINVGASAITGVYLGDQLLTNGGGDLEQNINTAIDTPLPEDLAKLFLAPDRILTNTSAMQAIANSEPSMDLLMTDGKPAQVMTNYPAAQSIYYNSPYIGKYNPGPADLQKGTLSLGYYGEVVSADFGTFTSGSQSGKGLTATTLAAQLGITQGTMMNDVFTWQKFSWQNEIWYISSKIIRYAISWKAINVAKAVFGGAILTLTRGKFKPYLLTGGVYEPSSNIGTGGDNMWDKLLRPLKSGGSWGTNYNDEQLDFRNGGNGYYTLCRDSNGQNKTLRYGSNGAGANDTYIDNKNYDIGWRPALCFVP